MSLRPAKFRVRLVRDGASGPEEIFEEVEAEGATLAYYAAMKAHNASEMWTPAGWEIIEDRGVQRI